MDSNPQSEQAGQDGDQGQADFQDQDAEPTMTAPDGARPDGKQHTLGDGGDSAITDAGSPSGTTDIEGEIASGGGGQQ